MSLDIDSFKTKFPPAVKHFWKARDKAARKQKERGISDQGNRAGVTAGKNMDGFIRLFRQIISDNGIRNADIHTDGRINLTIPGYYRPTKNWDLLVVSRNKLVAAIEFKSQVGPSFGNNFNNRVEEAIGNAVDLNTAFREGAFGESSKPFVGYFFVLEECEGSTVPVKFNSPHFSTFKDFDNSSYARRYEIFCRRLVHERLYDASALVLTRRENEKDGGYSSMSEITSAEKFVNSLAAKAAEFSLG